MSPLTRFAAALGGALGAAWVLARVGMWIVPPTREAWTVLAVGVDTDVLYARLSVGNTGFYADQLTTRLIVLRPDGGAVEHRAMYGPAVLGPEGVASGPDALEDKGRGWELRIGGDSVLAHARVAGAEPGCPPVPGVITGTLGTSPAGTTAGFDGGDILRGTAVVVRTAAVGTVEDRALYVLGNGAAIGIDPQSSCPAWARVGSQVWTGAAIPLPDREAGRVQVGPWEVSFRGTAAASSSHGLAHVSAFERALAASVGWPAPTLRAVRVGVHITGLGFDEPRTGVLLVRGTSLQ